MRLITNKSKNLLYRIQPFVNCTVDFQTSYAVATQRTADSATAIKFKIVAYKGTDYYLLTDMLPVSSVGKFTKTFTTPSTTGYDFVTFGLNGSKVDTMCSCFIDLKPSTTYTFTCNFTNITQGSISWKDMMLVEGSTAGDYEPFSYNLLDKWRYVNSFTDYGNIYTNNGEGSWYINSLNGTANSYGIIGSSFPVTAGHKIFLCGTYPFNASQDFTGGYFYCTGQDGSEYGMSGIYTILDGVTSLTPRIFVNLANRVDEKLYTPQVFDLTLMYGAGNEPTRANQFYADHPELKVSPLGFIGLKNLEISNKNIKRLRYATTTRNLFDARSATILTAYIIPEVSTVQQAYYDKTLVIPCEPNTSYTFSKQAVEPKARDRLCIAETSSENPEVGTSYTNAVSNGEPPKKNAVTITTTSTAKNLLITIGYFGSDSITTLEMILATCQLEKGSTATSYVPYGYLDLGIIPSNSGYILNKYDNLSEELLEENVEKDNINYHIPNKTNILLNKVEGKTNKIVQLVDKTAFIQSGTKVGLTFTCNRTTGAVTVNGNATASSFWNPAGNLPLINNHKYLICGNYTGSGITGLGLLNQNIYDKGSGAIGTAVTSMESPRNTWGIIWDSGTTFNNVTIYPQFFDLTAMYGFGNEPTTVEQFKKDYPKFFDEKLDGIWNVRTSGISTTGKNLFDIDSVSFFTKVSNGEYKSNKRITEEDVLWKPADGTKQVTISGYIKCPVGKNYMFEIRYTDGTTSYKSLHSDGNYNYQAITSNSSKVISYINITYYTSSDEVYIKDVQIEEGSTATDYEPYTDNKIDLLSKQTLNGINGVNDCIEVIDKGNGLYDLKKTKNIDSVDLGTLDWAVDGLNFSSSFISSVIKPPTNDNSVGNYTCQKYVNVALSKSFVDGDFGVNSSGGIYFRNSAYTTAAAFKTAMNGVILYYQLKTPVITTLAENLTYNQVSAIRTNGGLLLVNDNNNQKYAQPNVTMKENYQYKS